VRDLKLTSTACRYIEHEAADLLLTPQMREEPNVASVSKHFSHTRPAAYDVSTALIRHSDLADCILENAERSE
jgi:hypothetical protein